jgi:hypothetical protein
VLEVVNVIGVEYCPGPIMMFPSASLAVTPNGWSAVLGVPMVTHAGLLRRIHTIDAICPLTVKLMLLGPCVEKLIEVCTFPRAFPAPFAAS